MSMRVIECNVCGEVLAAANDDELERRLAGHMRAEHPDAQFDPERGRELVAREAYTAADS
jgi:hypothetical protein